MVFLEHGMKKLLGFFLLFSFFTGIAVYFYSHKEEKKCNFATAADSVYFSQLNRLIQTIHYYHKEDLGIIAVYDLGLSDKQKEALQYIDRVRVFPLEKVNDQQLQKHRINGKGKEAIGWYSFKPIVLKQASEFFDSFFYIDAGLELKQSMKPLFERLWKKGYVFVDCGQRIWEMVTQTCATKMNLYSPEKKKYLDRLGLSAGFQGITREIFASYTMPLYEYAKDISYFIDDGSSIFGFGFARHDQTLCSLQARIAGLKISKAMPFHRKNRRDFLVSKYVNLPKKL